MTIKNANRALKRALPEISFFDQATCYSYSFDSLKLSFMPDAVIQIREAVQVGQVLKLANRYQIPVTTRGAGTTRTAGATPTQGGWILDVSGLNSIRIDKVYGQAEVGPGAITAKLQERAEAAGWFYPPDPSSKKYSTIGGNIACNAGGLRGGKYGVTRDYVLGLQGFLPTGEPVSWARATRKFATGFNMRDLWIGSEGMLGVITGASLKLIGRPETKWTGLVAFQNETAALRAVARLLASQVLPSICEFMDRNAVRGAEAFLGRPIFAGQQEKPLVLLELDGRSSVVKAEKATVKSWAKETGLAFREARTPEAAEHLWEARRACSPAMFRLADSKLNEDIVVPLNRQVKLMQAVKALEKEFKLPVATFGHAGDGNLHINFMYHGDDMEEATRAHEAVGALFKIVVDLGGAISGEHGIGLAKSPFLETQFTTTEIQAMQSIKRALDPNNILNPDKIFKPTQVWEHRPVKHQFPWDRSG